MIWLLLAAWLALGWLLLTECSYLPAGRAHAGLYDRLAWLYPAKLAGRAYRDASEQERLFLEPLRALAATRGALEVLDLGCGSGRYSLLLLRQPWFTGRIVAIDLSANMLDAFRRELATLPECDRARVTIVHGRIDEAIARARRADACVLLEVGEFLPGFADAVASAGRLLRPGGVLLLTCPPFPYSLLFPGRAQSRRALARLLARTGFEKPAWHDWRRRYAVVHARRASDVPRGHGPALSSVPGVSA